jgi:hypothetical protein
MVIAVDADAMPAKGTKNAVAAIVTALTSARANERKSNRFADSMLPSRPHALTQPPTSGCSLGVSKIFKKYQIDI